MPTPGPLGLAMPEPPPLVLALDRRRSPKRTPGPPPPRVVEARWMAVDPMGPAGPMPATTTPGVDAVATPMPRWSRKRCIFVD